MAGEQGLRLLSDASVSLSESVVWLRLGVGEARLGMDTEEKKGKESGSCPDREPDFDLDSLDISRENEARRNFGKYFGDLDLGSADAASLSGLRSLLSPSRISSTASSTEDTLDRPWCLQ